MIYLIKSVVDKETSASTPKMVYMRNFHLNNTPRNYTFLKFEQPEEQIGSNL